MVSTKLPGVASSRPFELIKNSQCLCNVNSLQNRLHNLFLRGHCLFFSVGSAASGLKESPTRIHGFTDFPFKTYPSQDIRLGCSLVVVVHRAAMVHYVVRMVAVDHSTLAKNKF